MGGIVCHWAWGGKLGRQHRPGVRVDHRHPTDLLAGPEPLLLDGVDLPEVVGRIRPGRDGAWPLGPPGAVDSLLLEGALQRPYRGDRRGGEEPEEFEANPPGTPSRVFSLESTGSAEDIGLGPRHGSATGRVVDDQAVIPRVTEGTPEIANGAVREVEIGGDLSEALAVEVSTDDVLARGERDGARHERSPWSVVREYPEILSMPEPRGYNFMADPGG